MDNQQKLEELNRKWVKKCKCPLKNSATQAVLGNGNPDSDIVFIGEAPGRDEDIQGKPFVGAAGKFLNQMLEETWFDEAPLHEGRGSREHHKKLKREDVYITNIVKYRPPGNRDPEPEEIAACQDWLWGEIKIIKPKLIVFLGRHAMNHFFPNEKISQIHGKLLIKKIPQLSDKKQNFLALYHPAAALYNGSMRKVLLLDFKKIPLLLKKL